MNIHKIQVSISEPRFASYLKYTNNNLDKALELYLWNCHLSESLYTPVHILEVTLRNYFHAKLSLVYGDSWYDDIHESLQEKDILKVNEVKDRLLKEKGKFNTDDIISSLSMGFWVGLLWRHYETRLWRPCLYKAFVNAPKPLTRSDTAKKLAVIKNLRNRIAHHEPVYNRNSNEIYLVILEVLGWICKDTQSWLSKNSNFDKVYSKGKFLL